MLKPLSVVVLAAAAILALLFWKPWESSASLRDVSERASAASPASGGPQQSARKPTSQAVALPAKPAGPAASLARPFALDPTSDVPHEARGGNTAAQLDLSRALEYCRTKYLFYFGRGPSYRTLDQGLAVAASRGASMDEARHVHERCDAFMRGNPAQFGTADEWLEKAAASGSCEARLLRVQRDLRDAQFGVDDEGGALPAREVEQRRAEATAVLVEGLERKDPAALWTIGDLQKDDKSSWVWFLAACKSGYDCSQSAQWYQSMCQTDYNCQPYETATELIRRINAGRYPDLEWQSNELLKRIDAGEVGDLGLRQEIFRPRSPRAPLGKRLSSSNIELNIGG
jgi:hypothetical protein